MDKEKLRKADLATSILVALFGFWICYEALGMPMTDSYGGVQNVWFVSPALFPLCVGISITVLGLTLFKVALSAVGASHALDALRSLVGTKDGSGTLSQGNFRFLAIVVLFVCYVYLYIPRVDFLICSLFFLFTFINMFHLEDEGIMKRMLRVFGVCVVLTILFFVTGLDQALGGEGVFPADWLTCIFLGVMYVTTWKMVRQDQGLRTRFRNGTLVAFCAPFILGPVFKFFLLVPLPFEGIVVGFLDMLWYWEF